MCSQFSIPFEGLEGRVYMADGRDFGLASPSGAGVVGGVLYVVGTEGDDKASVHQGATGFRVSGSFFPGGFVDLSAPPGSVSAVVMFLGGGNDYGWVKESVSVPVVEDGGAGNDEVSTLGPRGLVIGGQGADSVNGGPSADLLVSGTTAFDENVPAGATPTRTVACTT